MHLLRLIRLGFQEAAQLILKLLEVGRGDLVLLEHLHVHLLLVLLAQGLEYVILAHACQCPVLASRVGLLHGPLLAFKLLSHRG